MAKQLNSTYWATTFFWEQDLRSLYMNGLLNSVLKPGVYNANMFLFATAGNSSSSETAFPWLPVTPGVYLYLKKGTTFVFSNNYKYIPIDSSRNALTQDLETPGNFLIKSVVLNDTAVCIQEVNDPSAGGAASPILKAFFGDPSDNATWANPGEIYISAMIPFGGEGALETESGYDSQPVFSWGIRKVDPVAGADSDTETSPYHTILDEFNLRNTEAKKIWMDNFWFVDNKSFTAVNSHRMVPDGYWSDTSTTGPKAYVSQKHLDKTSYLFLGRILAHPYGQKSYINPSGQWISTGVRDWNANHVFTGLGLPTYRQEQFPGFSQLRPGAVPAFTHESLSSSASVVDSDGVLKKSKFAFDLKNLQIGNRLFTMSDNGSYLGDMLNIQSSSSLQQAISETEDLQSNTIYADIFYLLLKFPDSTAVQKTDLLKLSSVATASDLRHFSFAVSDSDPIFTELASFGNDWVDKFGSENLGPQATVTMISSKVLHNVQIASTPQVVTFNAGCPLDVSPIAIERLKDVLDRTDFLKKLIEYFRREEPDQLRLRSDVSPLQAVPADTLVPLLITFRTSPTGSDSTNSSFSTTTKVVPYNVLDFFSLTADGSKTYSVNLSDQNLYTVLPVMQ